MPIRVTDTLKSKHTVCSLDCSGGWAQELAASQRTDSVTTKQTMKQTKTQAKQQNNKNVTQKSSINEETNIHRWKRILNDDLMILLSERPKRCHHGVYKGQLTIWEGELGVIFLSFENWKHPDRNEKVAEVITFKCNHFDYIEALIIALSIRHGVCCNIHYSEIPS